jgi:hypothetical protein
VERSSTHRQPARWSTNHASSTTNAEPPTKLSSKSIISVPRCLRGRSSALSAKPMLVPARPRPTQARRLKKEMTAPSGTAALSTPAMAVSAVVLSHPNLRPEKSVKSPNANEPASIPAKTMLANASATA